MASARNRYDNCREGAPVRIVEAALRIVSLLCVFLVLVMPGVVRAQVREAAVSGTITSASGAPIPNASLSVKNLVTGKTERFTVDADGTYVLKNLVSVKYEIRA